MKITLLTLALACSSLLVNAQQTVETPNGTVPVKSIEKKETEATKQATTTVKATSIKTRSEHEAILAEPKKVKAINPKKIK